MATKTIPTENKEIEATSAGMSFLGDDLLRSAIFVLQSVFDSWLVNTDWMEDLCLE